MLGVSTGPLLRGDQLAVDLDLEDAAARRQDHEICYLVFELFEYPLRQTDGSRRVASLSAVFDAYLHSSNLNADDLVSG